MKASRSDKWRAVPIVVVLLCVTATAWGQRLCPWQTDTSGIKKALGLSADQEKKAATLGHNFRAAAKPLCEKMGQQRQELHSLWKADQPDRSQIEAKLQEMDATRAEMRKACLDYQFEVRDLLTAAQRKKLASVSVMCPACACGECGMMGGQSAGMGMRGKSGGTGACGMGACGMGKQSGSGGGKSTRGRTGGCSNCPMMKQ